MRWHEISESASAGATSEGSVSVVQQPMGMLSRNGQGLLTGKYSTDSTPNTPKEYKRTNHVSGRFKNSISN